jgi:hypothetical protein
MKEHSMDWRGRIEAGAWIRLFAGVLALTAFVLLLMQGYAPPGPAGEVFRNNLEAGIDATPLFYTDLEIPTPDD